MRSDVRARSGLRVLSQEARVSAETEGRRGKEKVFGSPLINQKHVPFGEVYGEGLYPRVIVVSDRTTPRPAGKEEDRL